MASSAQKMKYDMEYAKAHLKRVPLDLKIEFYEEVKQHSAKMHESLNAFIKRAINETIERDEEGTQ